MSGNIFWSFASHEVDSWKKKNQKQKHTTKKSPSRNGNFAFHFFQEGYNIVLRSPSWVSIVRRLVFSLPCSQSYFEQVKSVLEYVPFPIEFLKEILLPPVPLNMRLRPVIVFGTDTVPLSADGDFSCMVVARCLNRWFLASVCICRMES